MSSKCIIRGVNMSSSKLYFLPRNVGMGIISDYLSKALKEDGISIEPIDNKRSDIYLDGIAVGSIEYEKGLGFRTNSSYAMFDTLVGDLIEREYKDTNRFNLMAETDGSSENEIVRDLTVKVGDQIDEYQIPVLFAKKKEPYYKC